MNNILLPYYWNAIVNHKMKEDILLEILQNYEFSHIQKLYVWMQNDLIQAEKDYEKYYEKAISICQNKKTIQNDKKKFEENIKRLWCWISYIRYNFIE